MHNPPRGLNRLYAMLTNQYVIVVVLLVYLLLFLVPHLIVLPISDEALYLLPARLMGKGWVIYRDFFSGVFPASLAFAAVILQWTDNSVTAIRFVTFLITMFTLALTLQMGRRFLGRWAQLLFVVFMVLDVVYHQYLFTHHTLSGPLSVWAVYCLYRYQADDGQQRFWLWAAGALLGGVLMSTQSTGVVLLGGLSVWCVAYETTRLRKGNNSLRSSAGRALLKTAVNIGLPFLLVTAGFVVWMAALGVLPEFYQQTVAWILGGHYQKTSSNLYFATGLMDIWRAFMQQVKPGVLRFLPWMLPAGLGHFLRGWLPVLGLLWGTQLLWERRNKLRWDLLLLVWGGWLLLISTLSYSSTYHVVVTGWLGYLLGAMALQNLWRGWPRIFQVLSIWLTVLYLVATIGIQFWIGWEPVMMPAESGLLNRNWVQSYGTAEKFFLDPRGPYAAAMMSMMSELARKYVPEDEPMYAMSDLVELYLLSDRQPASGHFLVYPVVLPDEAIQKIEADLREKMPRVIFYDHQDVIMVDRDFRFRAFRNNPPRLVGLHRFMAEHYQTMPLDKNYEMLMLKPRIFTGGS